MSRSCGQCSTRAWGRKRPFLNSRTVFGRDACFPQLFARPVPDATIRCFHDFADEGLWQTCLEILIPLNGADVFERFPRKVMQVACRVKTNSRTLGYARESNVVAVHNRNHNNVCVCSRRITIQDATKSSYAISPI